MMWLYASSACGISVWLCNVCFSLAFSLILPWFSLALRCVWPGGRGVGRGMCRGLAVGWPWVGRGMAGVSGWQSDCLTCCLDCCLDCRMENPCLNCLAGSSRAFPCPPCLPSSLPSSLPAPFPSRLSSSAQWRPMASKMAADDWGRSPSASQEASVADGRQISPPPAYSWRTGWKTAWHRKMNTGFTAWPHSVLHPRLRHAPTAKPAGPTPNEGNSRLWLTGKLNPWPTSWIPVPSPA